MKELVMTNQNRFQVDAQGNVTILRIHGASLFAPDADELCQQLIEFVSTRQPPRVIVDFSEVTRCSTAVINALLLVKKQLLSADGEVKLCNVSDGIRHVYRMLNLDGTVFEIHDSLSKALEAFRDSPPTK
jgi:anti-anti-sigma regulatory factor